MEHISYSRGLTLIELIVCTVIIGVLASTAVPISKNFVRHEKEQALRVHLRMIRKAIDRYYESKKKLNPELEDKDLYPKTLEDIVSARKLRKIPIDPFTKKRDWLTISSTDDLKSDVTDGYNVFDVRSSSNLKSAKGESYRDW